jgi:hypothetical protein
MQQSLFADEPQPRSGEDRIVSALQAAEARWRAAALAALGTAGIALLAAVAALVLALAR